MVCDLADAFVVLLLGKGGRCEGDTGDVSRCCK